MCPRPPLVRTLQQAARYPRLPELHSAIKSALSLDFVRTLDSTRFMIELPSSLSLVSPSSPQPLQASDSAPALLGREIAASFDRQ